MSPKKNPLKQPGHVIKKINPDLPRIRMAKNHQLIGYGRQGLEKYLFNHHKQALQGLSENDLIANCRQR